MIEKFKLIHVDFKYLISAMGEIIEQAFVKIDHFLDYYNNYKPQRKLDRLPPIKYRDLLITKQKGEIPLEEST
jgi:transposase InsO family protein